jgi:hypothetical protein
VTEKLYEMWLEAAEATAATLKGGTAGGDAEAPAQATQQRARRHVTAAADGLAARAVTVPNHMETALDAGAVSGKRQGGEEDN